MSHVPLLQGIYRDFAEGNIEAVLAKMHPEIQWKASKGLPYIEHEDGLYVGPQAVLEGVFARIPEYYDGFHIEILRFVDGGDHVVMCGNYRGTCKPTGKQFDVHATHTWTIADGLLTEFFQAVDSAAIISAAKLPGHH